MGNERRRLRDKGGILSITHCIVFGMTHANIWDSIQINTREEDRREASGGV
jgi:hypothetical protein